jgi:hypothetical protein
VPLGLTIDRFTNGLTRPFFGWGEIFSLFPSTLTDTFGTRNATRNYGCLYMAQGIGAIFGGPMASLLHEPTGTWTSVFARRHHRRLLTAVLAIAALKPLRAAYHRAAWRPPGRPPRITPHTQKCLIDCRLTAGLADDPAAIDCSNPTAGSLWCTSAMMFYFLEIRNSVEYLDLYHIGTKWRRLPTAMFG